VISLGVASSRQDLKAEQAQRKPAATWLIIPVIAFYLAIVFAVGRVIIEFVPMIGLAVKSRALSEETNRMEQSLKESESRLKAHDQLKQYVQKKDVWVQETLGAGFLMHQVFSAIPSNVKLRGLAYEYSIPAGQNTPSVRLRLQFRGATETGRVSSVLRQLDERLTMINSRQVVTDQGMELEVEYRVQR
jgi:hypothetical protein